MYVNSAAKAWRVPAITAGSPPGPATEFHRSLPGYAPTPLVPLKQIAEEIGVKAVFVKDESDRLGLPSFKILGASWATMRAVIDKVGLPPDSDLEGVKTALSNASEPITLLAATDGNHGRAVARMGAILGLAVQVFVPRGMHPVTVQIIKNEGALVIHVDGPYDLAVQTAFEAAGKWPGGILIQDTAFAGYEEIPRVSSPKGTLECSAASANAKFCSRRWSKATKL
jgi:diaminopropionate ammonia-lyase family